MRCSGGCGRDGSGALQRRRRIGTRTALAQPRLLRVIEGDATRPRYRIAMVAAKPFPVPQGSQVLVRQTAELVQSLGHEVHVVVYGYGAGETPAGLRVHRSTNVPGGRKTLAGPSWAKPFQDGAMVRILRRVIREHGIDIVHAHNYEGLLVALVAGHRP